MKLFRKIIETKKAKKFNYGILKNKDGIYFAVNAKKYTQEQAFKIFETECKPCKAGDKTGQYNIAKAFIRWGMGMTEDFSPCLDWQLEYPASGRKSWPVWVFLDEMAMQDWCFIRHN